MALGRDNTVHVEDMSQIGQGSKRPLPLPSDVVNILQSARM